MIQILVKMMIHFLYDINSCDCGYVNDVEINFWFATGVNGVNYNKYTLFDKIELNISKTDLDFLCEKRFFTDKPTLEDIQSEFVIGTGITPNKAHLMSLSRREETGKWKESSKRFHEYVDDLRAIENTDVNSMARELIASKG